MMRLFLIWLCLLLSSPLLAQADPSASPQAIASPTAAPADNAGGAEAPPNAIENRLIVVETKVAAAEGASGQFTLLIAVFSALMALGGFVSYKNAVNAARVEIADQRKQVAETVAETEKVAKKQRAEFDRQKREIETLLDAARKATAETEASQVRAADHEAKAKASLDAAAALLERTSRLSAADTAPSLTDAEKAQLGIVAAEFADKPVDQLTVSEFMVLIGEAGSVNGNWELALDLARKMEANFPEDQEALSRALFEQAYALGELGKGDEELAAYDSVVSRFKGSDASSVQEQVGWALLNKSYRLGALGRSDEELAAYDVVVSLFGDCDAPALQEQVAVALVNKGARLGTEGGSDKQFAAFDEVVARFGGSDAPALQVQVAMALVNKGIGLGALGRSDEELAAYDAVVSRFGDSEAPALQELVAAALVNKGRKLEALGKSDEAIAANSIVVARFGASDAPALQEQVAMALINKGVSLGALGRSDEELAAYDAVLARFGGSDAHALQEAVAEALFNKACVFALRGRVRDCIVALGVWGERRGGIVCAKIANYKEFDAVRDRASFRRFLKAHGCA